MRRRAAAEPRTGPGPPGRGGAGGRPGWVGVTLRASWQGMLDDGGGTPGEPPEVARQDSGRLGRRECRGVGIADRSTQRGSRPAGEAEARREGTVFTSPEVRFLPEMA